MTAGAGNPIAGKHILLGVTGSIAAYKSAFLTRLLVKAGAQVRVVMTPESSEFITPLTLATLSKNPVEYEFIADKASGTWNNHVAIAEWADLIVVAPATTNTIAKMVDGLCDNLLMAVFLSARCQVMIAPAMDREMYLHPSNKSNIQVLSDRGCKFIDPEYGELASGLEGKGRMAEPEHIVAEIEKFLATGLPLAGLRALVTAGPTYEPIDPVRFIGNHSSGKMGFAIAEALAAAGAEVDLISGPTALETPRGVARRTDVSSTQEMYEACLQLFPNVQIAVMAAAIADYRPESQAQEKIKKSDEQLNIKLVPNPDILKTLGAKKNSDQFLVGFALETDNEETNALKKLKNKNLDLIVLNSLRDKGAGFGTDTNKVTIFDRNNNRFNIELKSKPDVARDIVQLIERSLTQ